jgi:hypothetical protein
VAALAAVGLLLVWRRLAGAVTADLPTGHLVATALVAGVIILGGRWLWRRLAAAANGEELDQLLGWAGSAALILIAAGCSLGRLADWLLWVPLVAIEQTQLRWFAPGAPRKRLGLWAPGHEEGEEESHANEGTAVLGSGGLPREIPPLIAAQGATAQRSGDVGSPVLGCSHPFEGGGVVLQQLSRVRDDEGVERVHGTLVAEFATGQRQATVYVGFCPPLGRVPVVEAETVDGPEAELKVAQALCHGARVEVRLSNPAAEACQVVIELVAGPGVDSEEVQEEEMARE